METERVWVTVTTTNSKVALGGIYLRCNSAKNSEYYQKNKELCDKLNEEMMELKQMGFGVILMGDFNARIGQGKLGFQNYQHEQNNNGELLVELCEVQDLKCLNSMMWHGRREDYNTYRRDFGAIMHQSLLDYAVVSENAVQYIQDFKV